MLWRIPEISAAQLQEIQQHKPPQPIQMVATLTTSLTDAWESMRPPPVGILDQLERQENQGVLIMLFIDDGLNVNVNENDIRKVFKWLCIGVV